MSVNQPVAIRPGEGNQNSLHVCWKLHNACNYRCSYCVEGNWGGSHRWLKYADVEKFWKRLTEHYQRKQIHVSFTGGEPTLWPGFARLCRSLRNLGHDVGATSNGSRSPAFWRDVQDCFNWLCLSYQPEFTNDDHFAEVIRLMAGHTRLAIRMMMPKQDALWKRSQAFAERIQRFDLEGQVFVEYVPLLDKWGTPEVTPLIYADWQREFLIEHNNFVAGQETVQVKERLQKLRDVWNFTLEREDGTKSILRPNEMVASQEVNFKNWLCYAGVGLLFIESDGTVYRGCCEIGGKIGNIQDAEIAFPVHPVLCSKSACFCGTDIQVQKVKIRDVIKPEAAYAKP